MISENSICVCVQQILVLDISLQATEIVFAVSGIYLGMATVRWLDFKYTNYNWQGLSELSTLQQKATRSFAQFLPYSWAKLDWMAFSGERTPRFFFCPCGLPHNRRISRHCNIHRSAQQCSKLNISCHELSKPVCEIQTSSCTVLVSLKPSASIGQPCNTSAVLSHTSLSSLSDGVMTCTTSCCWCCHTCVIPTRPRALPAVGSCGSGLPCCRSECVLSEVCSVDSTN